MAQALHVAGPIMAVDVHLVMCILNVAVLKTYLFTLHLSCPGQRTGAHLCVQDGPPQGLQAPLEVCCGTPCFL